MQLVSDSEGEEFDRDYEGDNENEDSGREVVQTVHDMLTGKRRRHQLIDDFYDTVSPEKKRKYRHNKGYISESENESRNADDKHTNSSLSPSPTQSRASSDSGDNDDESSSSSSGCDGSSSDDETGKPRKLEALGGGWIRDPVFGHARRPTMMDGMWDNMTREKQKDFCRVKREQRRQNRRRKRAQQRQQTYQGFQPN